MKVLIVEDETAAFDNLVSILASIDPMIEIMGNTEGVAQTVRWLKNNPKPDLIFMDIHLSDGSAFAIFSEMEVEVPIIFKDRTEGVSKMSSGIFREAIFGVIGLKIRSWFRKWERVDNRAKLVQN